MRKNKRKTAETENSKREKLRDRAYREWWFFRHCRGRERGFELPCYRKWTKTISWTLIPSSDSAEGTNTVQLQISAWNSYERLCTQNGDANRDQISKAENARCCARILQKRRGQEKWMSAWICIHNGERARDEFVNRRRRKRFGERIGSKSKVEKKRGNHDDDESVVSIPSPSGFSFWDLAPAFSILLPFAYLARYHGFWAWPWAFEFHLKAPLYEIGLGHHPYAKL